MQKSYFFCCLEDARDDLENLAKDYEEISKDELEEEEGEDEL